MFINLLNKLNFNFVHNLDNLFVYIVLLLFFIYNCINVLNKIKTQIKLKLFVC